MINDQVLLAMIINGEFGEFNQDSPVYNEALEALSNQYHSTYGTIQTLCNGSCIDIKSHLIWLQTMESFYNDKIYGSIIERGADSWLIHMDSANNAINGWHYGPSSDSWVWGNVDIGSQMLFWIQTGVGKGTKFVEAQADFVVLTVDQNKQMRNNGWHIGDGPYWGNP
jgi:hypothetical protein